MKILAVNTVADLSERALYRGLVSAGVEVELILSPRDLEFEAFRNQGIPVSRLEIKHRFDLNAIKKIRSILKRGNFDVVYAPANRGLSTSLFAAWGLPVKFVTYRGTQGNLSWLNPSVIFTHRSPRVDKIVCNCEAVRKNLIEMKFKENKLCTIYKGHDVAWYKSGGTVKRSELGFSESDFVVGMIANIRPLKGVNVLFEALSKLKERIPLKCLLVGDADNQYLSSQISNYNLEQVVNHLGFRRDVPDLINLCDVTVVASLRREGMPRAMIESMSLAVPVVATSVGGMKEVIEDGSSGLIVPPNDAAVLADALNRLYSDPKLRAVMGERARARIISNFGVEQYVCAMRHLFEELTSGGMVSAPTSRQHLELHADG